MLISLSQSMPYPDFLCIGAQKAGTTWLYHQLAGHPDIWLPPVKELHYFDRTESRYSNWLVKPERKGQFARNTLIRFMLTKHSLWALRFIFGRRNDKYYSALFKPSLNQVCGEITPAYSRQSLETIEHVVQLMPDAKIIYLLRNPVDRVWSSIKMYRRRNDVDQVTSYGKVIELKRKNLIGNSAYLDNIERWSRYYKDDQIFIGFYDQIIDDPNGLLIDIYKFLGVGTDFDGLNKNVLKSYNQGNNETIPHSLEYDLTKRYISELKALDEKFNNRFTKKWLERGLKILEADNQLSSSI